MQSQQLTRYVASVSRKSDGSLTIVIPSDMPTLDRLSVLFALPQVAHREQREVGLNLYKPFSEALASSRRDGRRGQVKLRLVVSDTQDEDGCQRGSKAG